jgi:rhamnosyltransferase
MTFSSFLDEILVVIVLYKRKPAECTAYTGLLKSEKPPLIFIYDNSPSSAAPEASANVRYVHDKSNSGLGKAYNEGFRIARIENKKWLLLFDQDTIVPADFLRSYFRSTISAPSSCAFVPKLMDHNGLISPFRWSFGKGTRIHSPSEKLSLHKYRFANSGLLISTDAFGQCGGYEENIQLDFSDIVFGEKLKQVTDHFAMVEIFLQQSFSGTENFSLDQALNRFSFFCRGALQTGKTFGNSGTMILRTLLRALGLSVKYKNVGFIKTFVNSARSY